MTTQNSTLKTYADYMVAAFASAAASQPDFTHCLSVAGHTVRLRFAGEALVPAVLPALAHLEIDAGTDPEIAFHLWDAVSTGIYPPPLPFGADDYRRYGHRAIADDGRIALMHALGTRIVFLYDREQHAGFFWTEDAGGLSIYERAAPLQTLLHWALSEYGLCVVHAAAVGTEHGGVLLVGNSGAGKSTTAMACLRDRRLDFLSDDKCMLSLTPVPQAFGIFSSAKLNQDSLGMLSGFDASVVARDTQHKLGKSLIHLYPVYSEYLRRRLVIHALMILKISDDKEPRITRIAPTRALRVLGPSSVIWLPGAESTMLRFLARLVSQISSYELFMTRDPVVNARYIAEFVEKIQC